MAAHAHSINNTSNHANETGNLGDIWHEGYFWKGIFTPGTDNRLLLTRVIDRLITAALQMAEKRTAATDIERYYTHITGEEIPEAQRDRLKRWVSSNYDPRDYPILSELELSLRREKEKVNYNDAVPMLEESFGRRFGPMIPFDEDEIYKGKGKTRR